MPFVSDENDRKGKNRLRRWYEPNDSQISHDGRTAQSQHVTYTVSLDACESLMGIDSLGSRNFLCITIYLKS